MNNFIKSICLSKSKDLHEFSNLDIKIETLELDCSWFCSCTDDGQVLHDEILTLINNLKMVEGPVVYWIELSNEIKGEQLLSAFIDYSRTLSPRAIPARKKYPDIDSNVLYVGKVKRIFWGRIYQHLGFHRNKWTQGLQLYFWTKELKPIFKINYCQFTNELVDILPLFEISLARRLRPILGKHK